MFLGRAVAFSFLASLMIAQSSFAADSVSSGMTKTVFELKSPEVVDGGLLPKEYTGDGASATLPLEWSGAPKGTQSYALIMHHVDREGKAKWYWILCDIPANTHSLPKNVRNVGTLGNNSINGRVEYAPPHSKGPGPKTYTYTLYALSSPIKLDIQPSEVNQKALLEAMQDCILATAELKVIYSRPKGADNQGDRQVPGSARKSE